jgi:prepilin-type processing-associated H-X9-DG protein
LGLARNVTPSVLPFGLAIKESEVVAPADMVAFVHVVTRKDWGGPPYDGLEPYYPHQDAVGASFCDGHVERIARRDFQRAQGASNDFWRRWNRDHEPHPEVWQLPP